MYNNIKNNTDKHQNVRKPENLNVTQCTPISNVQDSYVGISVEFHDWTNFAGQENIRLSLSMQRQYWLGRLADQVVFLHEILFAPRGFYIESACISRESYVLLAKLD